METKKAYIIYGGDCIPYEPSYPIGIVLTEERAKQIVQELQQKDEQIQKEAKQLDKEISKYEKWMDDNGIDFDDDEEYIKLVSEHFDVSKEYVEKCFDSHFNCPQCYYYTDIDILD